jgi:hypothetical protein
VNDTDLLKTAGREHKLASKLAQIFVVAPQLELASARVADFVGLQFLGEKDPLIKEILAGAAEAYKRSDNHATAEMAFLCGLFEPAERLYRRRYVARQPDRYFVWLPMIEPIPQFEARYQALQIQTIDEACPDEITRESAAFQLAARTLPGELFRLYLENHNENRRLADCEALAH